MELRDVVEAMIDERGITRHKLGQRIGHTNGSSITQSLNKGTGMTTTTLLKLCNAMDYEIVVRKKNYLRHVEGEMIIDEGRD